MDINELRNKIDGVDDKLVELFLERMDLAVEIAKYKKENELPVLSKGREREVLARVAEKSGDLEMYSHRLFTTLMDLSKARQSELMDTNNPLAEKITAALLPAEELFPKTGLVACPGVEGGNSQAACDKLFPRGKLMFVKNFNAVFDAVASGLCSYGVIPIENSSNGSVRGVYDLLEKKGLWIVRSAKLCIKHVLLGKKGAKLSDITEIRSHEQAIGQCSKFLAAHKDIATVNCRNTAEAAQYVAECENGNIAAIASADCAALYGLEVLAGDIADSENNYTRFVCIGKKPAIYAGADKISLVLACANQPGALCSILSNLSAHGVNLSKLESCPVVGSDFEFIFFLELDASVREPGVVAMLTELEKSCASFSFLGCYQEI